MPLYKWLGNQILTRFQNWMLGTALSEFHSGYRLYSTAALAQIPFERNTNDFHFDTEIIVQYILKKLRLIELPIPTYYGDEICHVNGLKYAGNVCLTMLRVRLQGMNLLFDRKFDVDRPEETYDLKLGFESSHTLAIRAARPGGHVLDVGCGRGLVAAEVARKGCRVTGMDRYVPEPSDVPEAVQFIRWDLDRREFPVHVSQFDQIFLLDIIEHLKAPEEFMEELRFATGRKRPELILTTANIGFLPDAPAALVRAIQLRKERHPRRHAHAAFHLPIAARITETIRLPDHRDPRDSGPISEGAGRSLVLALLVRLNAALIRLNRSLFSYQIFIRAQARPAVHHLLHETIAATADLRRNVMVG